MGSDHPVIWSHHQGRGRAWYTALGHTAASWSEPRFLAHILGGIRWTAGADSMLSETPRRRAIRAVFEDMWTEGAQMAVNSTPESAAADQVVPGSSGRVLADAEVAERVDALMAEMTISEKAGQLTQYFYFDLRRPEEIEATLHADFSRQPAMVEAALSEGRSGRCCS